VRPAHVRVVAWSALAAALALPKLRERLGLPRALVMGALLAGPPAAAVGLPPGRARRYGVFMAQMWGYLRAFELTYAHPERLRRRLRVEQPLANERALAGDPPPTVRLQDWRRRSRLGPAADLFAGLVYVAWAPARQAAMLWILARHPQRFARAAAIVGGTFDAGWVVYSARPAAPPWWAAKQGLLPGVRWVTVDVTRRLPLVPEQSERDDEQANPWTTMPSTHTASAAAVALALAGVDTRAGALGACYAALLPPALVYLGEHYAVDVLAGLALAVGVRAAEPGLRGPARRIARVIDAAAAMAWPRRRLLRGA
jgi:membrane-associated phospholipid phosphatase